MRIIYLLIILFTLVGGCINKKVKDQTFFIKFYENNKEIALITNDDTIEVDWNNFSFKLQAKKIIELDSIKIDGVSPSFAVISIDNRSQVKVGICSTISSNCLPKSKSTFWYNVKEKSLFENGRLILHPPADGNFEKEILDLGY